MFAVEIAAGLAAQSASLKADALDFLGDTANYANSLGVVGLAARWRARAALAKGISLLLLAAWVIGNTIWMAVAETLPGAGTIGLIGALALGANLLCAVLLWRHRGGDANQQSVWICSRNDAIGNVAVVAAAVGVFGTGTGWPDIAVAAILGGLGVAGGWHIIGKARAELRFDRATAPRSDARPPSTQRPYHPITVAARSGSADRH